MDWEERIELNPAVLAGKPVVRGTRIAVELVIERLADGWSEETILDQYPSLSADDIRACLYYASTRLRAEGVYPVRV
ncbi:MAG: DUF433 domain-containing protein [Chloroflexi bacterium]|nr:DUF433 domain-containing protein [Chloroflexota bacterium]